MPSLSRLLLHLERFDTYQAEDALTAALQASLGVAELPDLETAGLNAWAAFGARAECEQAWKGLVAFAEERLTNWHSLKINAVESAWAADPTGQDLQGMRRAVLINLRQGINDVPQLLPDAHIVQAMANMNPPHSFAFTQVLNNLRDPDAAPSPLLAGAPPLPPSNQELIRHLQVVGNAFKYLIG